MINYCTYFDKNYLSRGIALHDSLIKTKKKNFHLYVIAFDNFTYNFFKKYKLQNLTCVLHSSFEDKKLKKIKNQRTRVEYFWTCTPFVITFFLKKYGLKNCIYVDADIYFFSNDNKIFKYNKFSTLITSHNYHPHYDQTTTSGKYCVQYLYFKNNQNTFKVLNEWKKQCIRWCYNRVEENKFGDQKYLDDWPEKFNSVGVIGDEGFGVAPWNSLKYKIKNNFILKDKKLKLVFYHFHDLKFFFGKKVVFLSSYNLSQNVYKYIYKPYIKKLIQIENKYKLNFNDNIKTSGPSILYRLMLYFKFIIKIILHYKNFKKVDLSAKIN